jgi:hypothetical protein
VALGKGIHALSLMIDLSVTISIGITFDSSSSCSSDKCNGLPKGVFLSDMTLLFGASPEEVLAISSG